MADSRHPLVVAPGQSVKLPAVRGHFSAVRHVLGFSLTQGAVFADPERMRAGALFPAMTIRRVIGLVLAAAVAHLSSSRVPLACVSYAGMEASAPHATHGEMPMANSQPGDGHEEGAPSSQPCDHSGVPSACVLMTSCATAPAEPPQATLLSAATSAVVFAGTVTDPANPTLAPDTPPPRA